MQPNFRLQSISFLSYFLRLAKIRIFASLCLGICGTSLAHNIKAMMTCLSPCYQIQYNGRISPIKIIYLQIKLRFKLIPWLLPQFHNINWKQPCNTCMNKYTKTAFGDVVSIILIITATKSALIILFYSNCGKIFRGSSN